MAAMRIGITMRRTNAVRYDEPRDCLARDWARFLKAAVPEALWMPLVNTGDNVTATVLNWNLDALILTGGGVLGEDLERDETENALLDLAVQRKMPVLGVCRGLQVMHVHQGGTLATCHGHVASRHVVDMLHGGTSREVNSFHEKCLSNEGWQPPVILSRAGDGIIEAASYHPLPWCGVMWHPERESLAQPEDISLLRKVMGI